MIIIGYQGIGKSTLAGQDNVIDLESGNFWNDGKRIDDWYIYYCNIAEHLSQQGYVVFVSSHEVVRNRLKQCSKENICCIYPSILLRDEWVKKLEDRYNETKLAKDYKAWKNAEYSYKVNISDLMMCGFKHYEIEHMDYSLKDMVQYLETLDEF